jgi:hypothetical protein
MIEQALLNLGVNVTSSIIIEAIKKLILRKPNATELDIKEEISNITNVKDINKVEQIYNLIKGDENIVIGHNSSASGNGNIIIGNNRKIGGSNNIIIG